MARTGFWFQMARGQAMIRNRSMRQARSIKRTLIAGAWGHGTPLRPNDTRTLELSLTSNVKRARSAHKQWREYRALHLQFER